MREILHRLLREKWEKGLMMKTYEDKRIRFSYPCAYKLIRSKTKWGQYDIEKKLDRKHSILFILQIIPEDKELLDSFNRIIRDPFNEQFIDESYKGKYFESVKIGEREGIGHVVTLYDLQHKFIEKIYRYLFPLEAGGLYIEVVGDEDFEVDTYKGILESITVKSAS